MTLFFQFDKLSANKCCAVLSSNLVFNVSAAYWEHNCAKICFLIFPILLPFRFLLFVLSIPNTRTVIFSRFRVLLTCFIGIVDGAGFKFCFTPKTNKLGSWGKKHDFWFKIRRGFFSLSFVRFLGFVEILIHKLHPVMFAVFVIVSTQINAKHLGFYFVSQQA